MKTQPDPDDMDIPTFRRALRSVLAQADGRTARKGGLIEGFSELAPPLFSGDAPPDKGEASNLSAYYSLRKGEDGVRRIRTYTGDQVAGLIDGLPESWDELRTIRCCSGEDFIRFAAHDWNDIDASGKSEGNSKGGTQMTEEKKEYMTLSGYIPHSADLKVESHTTKDGKEFKSCRFTLVYGSQTSNGKNALVSVRTTADKLIRLIESGTIRPGDDIAAGGTWTEAEKDGRKYVDFIANNNSRRTVKANDIPRLKDGDLVSISGGVVKMAPFTHKEKGSGYNVMLKVDGKMNDGSGNFTKNSYVTLKTTNPEQVDLINKYFTIGKRVNVEGRVETTTYTDRKTGAEEKCKFVNLSDGNLTMLPNANWVWFRTTGERISKDDGGKGGPGGGGLGND